MKGQRKTVWNALAVLFVSAVLSCAQVNSLSAQAGTLPYGNTGRGTVQQVAAVGPGTLNYVEGQASLDGQTLSPQVVGSVALQPGQLLQTGSGYLEVLLTPGAFLRVGHDAQIRLLSAGLADTRIELVRGSAMLEVDQLIEGTNLAVAVGSTTARIAKTGLYNFDGTQQAVRVLDGKLDLGNDSRTVRLGKHDQVLLASGQPLKKRSFDQHAVEADSLYVWSKARSQDEAQANLMAARNADTYMAAGTGWFWDPYSYAYGFWPVAGSLYSPFGFGFYSPAYFGSYGGYYGGYYPGRVRHARVGGVTARVTRPPRVSRPAVGASGFHGGFHGSAGGGFHGGGHR